MEALYRRIDQNQRGEPVDADMSDVSSAAFERNTVYEREKWSFRQRAGGDLAVFWGQNANTQPVLFWLLAYVYSTPGFLDELREEIAPYIRLSQTEPPEITSMDLPALCHNCPLLKACIFETYHMANEATSIRYIARPATVNDGANKHQLKPGMFVSAPHSLIQRDLSVYADPDKFVPDRFLESDPESGKLIARYGRLKPWGSGAAMCKGRTFAEKEIVALSAAIMMLWNIGPAGGTWKLPAMVPGTRVKKPVEDIRVVITRRTF
jgi:cytochrome P450